MTSIYHPESNRFHYTPKKRIEIILCVHCGGFICHAGDLQESDLTYVHGLGCRVFRARRARKALKKQLKKVRAV